MISHADTSAGPLLPPSAVAAPPCLTPSGSAVSRRPRVWLMSWFTLTAKMKIDRRGVAPPDEGLRRRHLVERIIQLDRAKTIGVPGELVSDTKPGRIEHALTPVAEDIAGSADPGRRRQRHRLLQRRPIQEHPQVSERREPRLRGRRRARVGALGGQRCRADGGESRGHKPGEWWKARCTHKCTMLRLSGGLASDPL